MRLKPGLCNLAPLFLVIFYAAVFPATAADKKKSADRQTLTDQERALHVLNRLTFGPRPGDVDQVLSMGVDNWIEQQLHPAKISNGALDGRLQQFRTLQMQPKDLAIAFPPNSVIRDTAQGKKIAPTDPVLAGLYEVLVDKYNEQQKNAQAAAAATPAPTANVAGTPTIVPAVMTMTTTSMAAATPSPTPLSDADKAAEQQKLQQQQLQQQATNVANALLNIPKEKRMSTLMQMPMADRRAVASLGNADLKNKLLADFSPSDREAYYAMNGPTGVVTTELLQAKMLRAIYSERQLEEVMTDFWFNHFNVYVNKDADQYLTTTYEREVIRPHALGKFRDLLVATAQSPAMLYYLDNWTSIGPNSPAAGGGKPAKPGQQNQAQQNQAKKGLNENYARELMELHTLGVDGGYSQADVTEVARVFTGWTIQGNPELGGPFQFDPKRHEPGPKTVLGHVIPEGGQKEGMTMLDLLASSPATAKFVCTKLARRFVSDDPPASLVTKMSETWAKSDGDISEVLRTMLHSPEFWGRSTYRARVKTPLEFVVSAIRATGTDVSNANPLVQTLAKMGMPLYQMAPPTGYSTAATKWMNSDALLDRFNFSIQLAGGNVGGVKFDGTRVLALGVLTLNPQERQQPPADGPRAAVALLEDALIGGDVSQRTNDTITSQLSAAPLQGHLLDDPSKTLGMLTALVIGSPEFQQK